MLGLTLHQHRPTADSGLQPRALHTRPVPPALADDAYHCAAPATPPAGPPIHHFDLYRLQGGAPDLARLDLPASFAQAVCLVEWPERLAAAAAGGGDGSGVPQPHEPLEVSISLLGPQEQAALSARLQADAATAQQQRAASGAAEEEADSSSSDGSEDEEDESGGDARWRRIQLAAAGARWRPRLQLLRRYLAAEGAALGCYLEPEGGGPA